MTRRHRAVHAVFWLVAGPLGLLTLVLLMLNRPEAPAHSDLPLSTAQHADEMRRASPRQTGGESTP